MSSQLPHGLPGSGRNWIWAIAVCLLPVSWPGDCIGNDRSISSSNQAFSDDQEEVISQFLTRASEGIIYAFNDPAGSAASHLQLQYLLDAPAELHLNFMFYSATSSPQSYLFHCFIDYKPAQCLKDRVTSDRSKLTYSPKTRYQERLYLDFERPGLHDLLIVGVNTTHVSDGMKYPHDNIVFRTNVLVGTNSTKNISYKSVSGIETQNQLPEIQINGLKDPASFTRFNEAFEDGCANGFHIHVRNPDGEENNYAILSVVEDYSGASVTSHAEFVTIDSKTEISNKFKNIDCGSQKYAFSILVKNPYALLEKDGNINEDVDASVLLSNVIKLQ